MPHRLAILLVLASCSSLGTALMPDQVAALPGAPAAAKPSARPIAVTYRTLASCEGTEQPEATVKALRQAAAVEMAWQALPRFRPCPLPSDEVAAVDFKAQSVYLIGIPLLEMTLDPVIEAIEEHADEVVVQYKVVQRGEISLPATKTHFLALVFKATKKPVRLERRDS